MKYEALSLDLGAVSLVCRLPFSVDPERLIRFYKTSSNGVEGAPVSVVLEPGKVRFWSKELKSEFDYNVPASSGELFQLEELNQQILDSVCHVFHLLGYALLHAVLLRSKKLKTPKLVFLFGNSGVGKSSIGAVLSHLGYELLVDDLVFFRFEGEERGLRLLPIKRKVRVKNYEEKRDSIPSLPTLSPEREFLFLDYEPIVVLPEYCESKDAQLKEKPVSDTFKELLLMQLKGTPLGTYEFPKERLASDYDSLKMLLDGATCFTLQYSDRSLKDAVTLLSDKLSG